MEKVITSFRDDYAFLSNFFEAGFFFDGIWYDNSEAAFQAQKCAREERYKFSHLKPKEAKRLGRTVTLRPDWEDVKDQLMYEIVKTKFTGNEYLKLRLLNTGDAKLIEGNMHNDTYWGVCRGVGQNKLGIILMRVREEIKQEM